MNIYHKLDWDKCLSHEIWEAFKKGWPESEQEVHFFGVLQVKMCQRFKIVSTKTKHGFM